MANNVQDSINNAIDIIVGKRIDALALDKTVIGVIDSIVNAESRVYRIAYDGGYFNAVADNDGIYPKGMSVYVQIPQNDMSKKKTIIGRTSVMRDSLQADIVISSLHDYAIVGKNIVSPENESSGVSLRSYHNEKEETNTIGSKLEELISHRANLLYSSQKDIASHYEIDLNSLDLYKENATAIMVEADFRTSLDSKQQYSNTGVYGIKLNASFSNSNYQYGSTQGEIFDYFAPTVKAKIDETDVELSMTNIEIDIKKAIYGDTEGKGKKTNLSEWKESDKFLDEKIAYVRSLLSAYSIAAPAAYAGENEKVMTAYLGLLLEIKNTAQSLNDVKSFYEEWMNEKVEEPTKEVVYTFDSNTMTGNPFSFTSWSTQYTIFKMDFDNLESIKSIVFYKQGFIQDESMCQHGIDGNNDGRIKEKKDLPKEDLFIRNLKIYILQPISAINGDYRLEIQSPEGLIFSAEDEVEKELSIKGKITKAYYENVSDNAIYYWFKKNPAVISPGHNLYQAYGGIGWEYIGGPEKKGNDKKILISKKEVPTYKNYYKCVAIVEEDILLSDEFIIYNMTTIKDVEIISDIGQNFSFDAGTPLLTCRLKTSKNGNYTEINDNNYEYSWSIAIGRDVINFNDEALKNLDSIVWDEVQGTYVSAPKKSNIPSIADALKRTSEDEVFNLLKGVQFFNGENQIYEENNIKKASRLKLLISNFAFESIIQVKCYIQEKKKDGSLIDFGEGEISLQNQGHPQITSYRLVLENGDQIFQYDEYGNPPDSPKLKSPQDIKPVIPHLLNPAGVEVANRNYQTFWTIPIENTMIISNATLGKNPYDQNKISLDNSNQCSFKIAESYNEDNLNNQINCRILINDEIIQAETDFYFGKVGSNGTNGTDMVAKIVPKSTAQILNREPLTLYRWTDEDEENENQILFNTGEINTLLASNRWTRTIFQGKLYQKNKEVVLEEKDVRWNVAGNPQTTQNNFSCYIKMDTNNSLTWDETYNSSKPPVYILRAQIIYENKDYYAFYSFPVIWYNRKPPKYNKIAVNKATLLKEIVYNADGRNPVYNHNQGVELINVPEGCTISWYAYGGKNGNEATADFKLILNRNDKIENANTQFANKTNNFIYILPNDEYDGSNTNNRIVAYISKNNTNIAVVTIPLHMSLNTFGLASLNAWDGNTVTIDEDNGYVMAPQVGAGEKDSNNRFTGILMGKTETYTGSSTNEVETGLFGYAHGLQSIFLDANTGNAIFGLPDVQTTFDKDGNPIYNYANSTIKPKNDGYNEGQVELIPDGVSKIGGWRLGRRSLYYIEDNMEVGQRYSDTVTDIPDGSPKYISHGDYIPDKTGTIKHSTDSVYSAHHEKDIPHDKAGILIHSGSNPYISIKGRTLDPTGADKELLDDGSDSYLKKGDSLEIELDPQTPAVFSIFRHNGQVRKKENSEGEEKTIYEKDSRTFLAGINGKGQLIANGLQSSSNNDNSTVINDTVTTFGIDKVGAFGEDLSTTSFVGFKMFAGANTVAKLFVSDPAKSLTNTLYLTGGTSSKDEYQRPISIHGQKISLYARDNDNDEESGSKKTQKSKIIIDSSQFYGGNEGLSYINLNSSPNTVSETYYSALYTNNNLNIRTTAAQAGSIDIRTMSKNGNINLYTNNASNTHSRLTLDSDGNVVLFGAASGNFIAYDGNISLIAQNKGENNSWLTLKKEGDSTLRGYNGVNITGLNEDVTIQSGTDTTINAVNGSFNLTAGGTGNGLYLPVASVNKNAHLQSVRPLNVSSMGGLNIKANNNSNGDNGNLKTESALSTSVKAGTSLTVQTGAAISITTDGDQPNNIITIANTKYNPSINGSPIIKVSTKVGDFSIQKNVQKDSGYSGNGVLNSTIGLVAPYGYFSDTYTTNLSVYAEKGFRTALGSAGYSFPEEESFECGSYFTVEGSSVFALWTDLMTELNEQIAGLKADIAKRALITYVDQEVENLQNQINSLKEKVTSVENGLKNKLNESEFSNWKEDIYKQHTHNLTGWSTVTIGKDGGSVSVPGGVTSTP